MRLCLTTDKLQVVLAGAVTTNQLPAVLVYKEIYGGIEELKRRTVTTNDTTDIDLCVAPASMHIHDIHWFSIHNADTVAATVTVKYNADATEYIIFKQTLQPGQTLEWSR